MKMTKDQPKIIVIITGPTASGKSQFALDLASLHNGVILNADSVQLYRDLPILSAHPSPLAFLKIKHYFYGVLNASDQWNAALWCDRIIELLETEDLQDKLPFIVGGTGLYIKGLMEGFAPIPVIDPFYREEALQKLQTLGHDQFFHDLYQFDPIMAQKLNPHDTQRLIRAWEVYHGTGRPLSYWQAQPKNCKTKHYRFVTFCLNPPNTMIKKQANKRLDEMINEGALIEIQHLIDKNIPDDAPLYKTLGARPLSDHLKGLQSLEQAIDMTKTSTHQYIKRQQTWFRHQLTSCYKIDDFYSEEALRYGQSVLKEFNI